MLRLPLAHPRGAHTLSRAISADGRKSSRKIEAYFSTLERRFIRGPRLDRVLGKFFQENPPQGLPCTPWHAAHVHSPAGIHGRPDLLTSRRSIDSARRWGRPGISRMRNTSTARIIMSAPICTGAQCYCRLGPCPGWPRRRRFQVAPLALRYVTGRCMPAPSLLRKSLLTG